MKILFVTDLYPLFEGEDGIPLTLEDFTLGFFNAGHNVQVFRPNFILNTMIRKRKTHKNGLYQNSKNPDIKIFNRNFLFPFRKNSVISAYRKYFKDEKFDIILSHMPSGIMCAEILSKELNVPYLAAVHSSDITVLEDIKYFAFKKRMISAYKNSSCVLARSFWLKDKIRKLIPDLNKPVEIVYSGIPLKQIEENEKVLNEKLEAGKKFNPKKAKILTVSSLIKRKNIKTLILAYKKLKKKYPNISLEIIGDGPLKEKLENLNIKKKLDVKMPGKMDRKKAMEKMVEADIFILPSLKETFGMVYMEAMASGMAVCCTKNSGIDGIINDSENGFLLKPNRKGVINVLNKILGLKPKEYTQISQNAITTSKMFSYENSIQNYLDKIELFKI